MGLLERRKYHSSWDSTSGLILLGGYESPRTTEKILQDGGSSYSFELNYSTSYACAINLGSSVILTGGADTRNTVSQYNEAGWERDLPDLLQGRYRHGCTSYNNNDGTQTLLVAGGYVSGSVWLSSTELLVGEASAWVNTGELPSPRYALRGANIDSKVLMTGGYDGFSNLDDILEFEPIKEEWKLVDRMIHARRYHAVSTVTFD